ncbi:MAG: AraC family transcriptional regulator [Pseudomonadota bacterium]
MSLLRDAAMPSESERDGVRENASALNRVHGLGRKIKKCVARHGDGRPHSPASVEEQSCSAGLARLTNLDLKLMHDVTIADEGRLKHVKFGAHGYDLNFRRGMNVSVTTPVTLMTVRYDLQIGEAAFGQQEPEAFVAEPYSLIIHQRGTKIRCSIPPGGAEFICIALDETALRSTPQSDAIDLGRLNNQLVIGANIRRPALALRRLLLERDFANAGSADELVAQLAQHALGSDKSRWSGAPTPAGEMMLRASRLIQGRLADPLSIPMLADALGITDTRFARYFKHTFLETPYQYVIQRRLDRVRDLLAGDGGEMSLAQIALSTGFASQAHMTAQFRNVLGVPPGRYRSRLARGAGP